MRSKLGGNFTLLITPFGSEGAIDWASLERLIEHNIAGGVDGLIGLGSVGEFAALLPEERRAFAEFVVRRVAGRQPVGFSATANPTHEAAALARHAEQIGADLVMVGPPYYGPQTPEMIHQHLRRVIEAVRIPAMLYDGGGGNEIPLETSVRLIEELEHVTDVKVSVAQVGKLRALVERVGDQVGFWCGVPTLNLIMLAMGAKGISSSVSNVLPRENTAFVRDVLGGDRNRARQLFYRRLLPLLAFTSAQCVKQLLVWQGIIATPAVRQPLLPLGEVYRSELRAAAEIAQVELIEAQV
jgi:4-hydroxy-tetrahydrodipicolinate synthase